MANDTTPAGAPNRTPLKWAQGYFIDQDGAISRADGRTLSAFSLLQARRYAKQDIQHDPLHTSASGVQHGRGGDAPLVSVCEATSAPVVALLRLMPRRERRTLDGGGVAAYPQPDAIPAVGDTDVGWFYLRADDGAFWLLHGASYARHILSASD